MGVAAPEVEVTLESGEVSVEPPDEVVFDVPLDVEVDPPEERPDVTVVIVGLDGSSEPTVVTV